MDLSSWTKMGQEMGMVSSRGSCVVLCPSLIKNLVWKTQWDKIKPRKRVQVTTPLLMNELGGLNHNQCGWISTL